MPITVATNKYIDPSDFLGLTGLVEFGVADRAPRAGTSSQQAFVGPFPGPVTVPTPPPTPLLPPEALPLAGLLTASELVPLAGLGALGISLGLTSGAPPPVESLTGSGLEPQPEATAPPGVPPGGPPVAASPSIPPNWWQIGNPPLPFSTQDPVPVGPVAPVTSATLGDLLNNLLSPGNLGDISAAAPQPAFQAGPDPLTTIVVTGSPPAPEPTSTVTVTGTSTPAPSSASPLDASQLQPVGLPELSSIGDVGSTAPPHFEFTPPTPILLVPLPLAVTFPTFPAQVDLGTVNPLALPLVEGGVSTSPVLPFPRPTPMPKPIGEPTPNPNPVPDPVPNPVGSPQPTPGPNPVYPPPIPQPPTPNPIFGFGSGIPDPLTDPAAEAMAAAQHCVQTSQQQKDKQRKRKKRTVCHSGTYTEFSKGISKHPQRTIPCR